MRWGKSGPKFGPFKDTILKGFWKIPKILARWIVEPPEPQKPTQKSLLKKQTLMA